MSIWTRYFLLLLCSVSVWANSDAITWYSIDSNKQATVNVDLFLSSTCPHCHKENEFFLEIEPKNPWLKVHRYIINEDQKALILFNQYLTQLKFNDFAVPSAFFCNTRWVGFATKQTTGQDVLKALQYCKHSIEQKGTLTDAAITVMQRWANANMLNAGMIEKPSVAHYLGIVALLDSVNPCALYGFLGFLAVLFSQSCTKKRWIGGMIFVVAIELVHLFSQIQTNLFFQLVPWLRIFAALLGGISLWLVYRFYQKQSVHKSVFYIWVFSFGFIVEAYQQTCVMNWSYIFEQWLNSQSFALGQRLQLQVIFQLLYIVPPFISLCVYSLLQKWPRFAVLNPYLERVGNLSIAAIALLLIINPSWFSSFFWSFIVLISVFISGKWIGSRSLIK